MCLAIPGRVVTTKGDEGLVDFGGTRRWANLSLVDAKEGDYVVVHAGFAIQTMDEKDAMETLDLWRELLESMEDRTAKSHDTVAKRSAAEGALRGSFPAFRGKRQPPRGD